MPEKQTRGVYYTAAAFGAAALLVQTEFLRSAIAVTGGGALTVGVALGAWLGWIALGALAGKSLAARLRRVGTAVAVCCLAAVPAGLFLSFVLAGGRLLFDLPPGVLVPPGREFLWVAVACLPFAFLVGATFPLLAVLTGPHSGEQSGRIGYLWAAEALGAFCAGVVFTFVLAGRTAPASNIAVAACLPALAVSLSGVRAGKKTLKVISAGLLLSALALSPSLGRINLSLNWKSLGSPGKVIASRWTLYRQLILARSEEQYTIYDNGEPLLNFPDPYSDVQTSALLLSQSPAARNVLVIGPACSGLAQSLLGLVDGAVWSVHPDEALERLIVSNLPAELLTRLESGGRYVHVCADARVWLGDDSSLPPGNGNSGNCPGWNLVYLDLPGPGGMNSTRYYTPSFFKRVSRALCSSGGAFVLRLPWGATYSLSQQVEQAAMVRSALGEAFSHVALASGTSEIFVFASNTPGFLTENPDSLMSRLAPLESRSHGLSRYLIAPFYDPERIGRIASVLGKAVRVARPHSDFSPAPGPNTFD